MGWKLWTGNSNDQFQDIISAVTGVNGEKYVGKKEEKCKA